MKLNRVQYKSFSGLFDDSEEERLFAKFPGIKAAKIGRRSGGSTIRSTNRTLNKPTGGGTGTKPPAKPVTPTQPTAQQNPTYTLTGGSGNSSSTYYVGGTSTSAGSGTIQYPYYGGGSYSTPLKSTGGSTGGTGTKPSAGGGGYAGSAGLGNNGGAKSPITGGPASDFAAASTKTGTGSGQGGYAAMAGQGKSTTTITGGPASDFAAAQSAAKTGTGQGNTGGGVDPNYRYTSTTSTAGSGLNYANAPQTPNGGRKDITGQGQSQQPQVKPPANGGGQSTVDPAAAGKQRRQVTNDRKRVARQSYDAGYQKGMNSANEQISQMQSQLDAANNAAANTGVSQGLQNTWNNAGFMTKAGMLGATGAGLYFLGKGVMDTVDGNGQDRQRY